MNRELTSTQLWTVLAVALCVVIAIYMFFGIVQPERAAAANMSLQVTSTKTTLSHLLTAPHPAEPSASEIQGLAQRLPSTANQPQILTLLSEDAAASHATIQSLAFLNANGSGSTGGSLGGSLGIGSGQSALPGGNPNAPQVTPVAGLMPVEMQITVAGSYGDIESFVQGLQHGPRLMEVASISFQSNNSSSIGSGSSVAQIVVAAFMTPQSAQLGPTTGQ